MLNNSGVCGHSLVSNFNGNVISGVCPLSVMLFCGLRKEFFYHVKEESIYSYLINFNRCQTLSNAFLVPIKIIIAFFQCTTINMMKYIMMCFYNKSTLYHPNTVTWSWHIIF